jgi:hypothetical protein
MSKYKFPLNPAAGHKVRLVEADGTASPERTALAVQMLARDCGDTVRCQLDQFSFVGQPDGNVHAFFGNTLSKGRLKGHG